jgi:hypothetical protein
MKSISAIIDQDFVNLSIEYAHSYKRDGRAFLSSYRKFDSVRSSCEMIVSTYKRIGAYEECSKEKDFRPYAEKYFKGRQAEILADMLLIIYNIIK